MRRILGVTGIRSEYDIMSSVFRAITDHPQLELQLAVTGAHLSDAYGCTVQEIRSDGFTIADEIESLVNGDQASPTPKVPSASCAWASRRFACSTSAIQDLTAYCRSRSLR
jgi:GDP/UDP-N,N'-diacetylbacillosamine 2-epimerase (hydrolysing)